jgi:hypothetical protein
LNSGESIIFLIRSLLQWHRFKALHSQLKWQDIAEWDRREWLWKHIPLQELASEIDVWTFWTHADDYVIDIAWK